ncbi:50S ribosomal protein L24 [Fimbriimonas ginsengisoli]|uniref:Large ribosomal subunit protein uL24 n=1 Tax=Fimbriimonas ginsengisoli Gsoil 348 TaxID=661478 RepID=A0A068NWL2_FIMGI|nr:50S ribosomal protein L24 [Fimbriimonas ginsengisoli]AIE87150.1 ribosomal protein L24 [Fimbriimonas ginsengisoli Gsoil 348]
MPTKAEIKLQNSHIKLKVRKGDRVMIISGKDKGEIGFVAAVAPKEQKAIILKENDENPDQPLPLNAVIKHRKARTQGERSARIKLPAPIHISNLMVLDPNTNQPTRVGRRKDDATGKLVRYAKKTGTAIPDAEVMAK